MRAQEVLTEMRGTSSTGRPMSGTDNGMAMMPIPEKATPTPNQNEKITDNDESPGEEKPVWAVKSFIGAVGTATVPLTGSQQKNHKGIVRFHELQCTPGTKQFEKQLECT